MRVLIVHSHNFVSNSSQYTFIKEQADALQSLDIIIEYFGIVGKGVFGYLSNYKKLLAKIKVFNPDIIHAHYGLSGLLANLQRRIPVITTYHGSDLNNKKAQLFSHLCIMLSAHNIFVANKILKKGNPKNNYSLIPCGVDTHFFKLIDKHRARQELKLDLSKKIILFAGPFNRDVKNSQLAKDAIALLKNIELIELKGYTREQVAILLNAVDAILMTSKTEGSPQVIKEAMACGCPIVSVDVGDVKEITNNTIACYICDYDTHQIAEKLNLIITMNIRTNGRDKIYELNLDNQIIARKLVDIYLNIIKKKLNTNN